MKALPYIFMEKQGIDRKAPSTMLPVLSHILRDAAGSMILVVL